MDDLFLEPVDNWFRDGRPFEAGQEHTATSLFPPPARTVIGALRGRIFREAVAAGGDVQGYLRGQDTPLGGVMGGVDAVGPCGMQVRGPFVALRLPSPNRVCLYLAPPADVAQVGNALENLRPLRNGHGGERGVVWEDGSEVARLLPLWVRQPDAPKEVKAGEKMVSACLLHQLLRGAPAEAKQLTSLRDLVEFPRRSGNELAPDTKTVVEGHLYEIALASPKRDWDSGSVAGLSLQVAGFDQDALPPDGAVVQLGGEGRWAIVRRARPCSLPLCPRLDVDAGIVRFRQYLATPCVLSRGWLPNWLAPCGDQIRGTHPVLGHEVRLVSVAMAGTASLGGWDLARRRSRGSRTAIGAGTVYFFETEAPPAAVEALHQTCFGDRLTGEPDRDRERSNDQQLGSGLSFIGRWEYVSAEAMDILFIYTEEPVHVGVGQGLGAIDQPIQREEHTGYPTIFGSSARGALKEAVRSCDKSLASKLFGDTEGQGILSIPDARVVMFPIQSLFGGFAWVTCPGALAVLLRNLAIVGKSPGDLPDQDLKWSLPPMPHESHCFAVSDSPLRASDNGQRPVVLKEYCFDLDEGYDVGPLACWLSNLALPCGPGYDDFLRAKVKTNLVVLSDGDFGFFMQTATQVVTRVRLKEDSKVTARGGLWIEELLPPETLLQTPLVARALPSERCAQTSLESARKALCGRVCIGGTESVGRGRTHLTWLIGGKA